MYVKIFECLVCVNVLCILVTAIRSVVFVCVCVFVCVICEC